MAIPRVAATDGKFMIKLKKITSLGKPAEIAEATGTAQETPRADGAVSAHVAEIGGPPGLEPTRYGDWERRGRCIDF